MKLGLFTKYKHVLNVLSYFNLFFLSFQWKYFQFVGHASCGWPTMRPNLKIGQKMDIVFTCTKTLFI